MTPLFTKLNLGSHRDVLVVDAPASFEPELAALTGVTIRRDPAEATAIPFALAEAAAAAEWLPKSAGDA